MDIQAKLIFSFSKPPSENITKKYIELDCNDIDTKDEIISFTEHTKVSVKVESLDEEVCIEIEKADSDGYTIVKKDEEVIISEGIENGKMYVPGYYKLNLRLKNRLFKLLIKVTPSSISYDGLLNIREVLEDTISGLAYNLYLQKSSNCDSFQNKKIPIIQMAHYIIDNKNFILNCIDKIVKDPIVEMKKSYREVNYSRKIDLRTVKWLSTKGLVKNRIPTYPEISYEKKTELSYFINENRWFKRTMIELNEIILEVENYINNLINNIEEELSQKNSEFSIENDKSNDIKNNNSVSTNYKNSVIKKINLLKKECLELNENLIFIKNKIDDLISLRSRINFYIFNTWIFDITKHNKHIKIPQKVFINKQYSQFYFFYKNLINLKENKQGEANIDFPFKSTSLLFEIYVVIRVIEILQEEGYTWERGWLADFEQDNVDVNLPKETTLIFKKKNLYCELAYDSEILGSVIEKDKSQFINNNPSHRRPDIRLSLFDLETKELINAIIIEVKCRKKKYLFSDKGDTETIETMKAYHSFSYYDSLQPRQARRKDGVISEVVLVYPKQEGKNLVYPDDGYNNFEFIALDPNKEKSLEQGYETLKKNIQQNLFVDSMEN